MADSRQQRYKVPGGFRALLEALAREVLRAQPTDIYAFSELFFHELQRHRRAHPGVNILEDANAYDDFKARLQEASSSQQLTAPRSNDNNNEKQQASSRKSSTDRPRSPLDDAATKIQAAFRGHHVRAHPEQHRPTAAAVVKSPVESPPDSARLRRRSNEFLDVSDTKKDLKRHSVGYVGDFNTPEDRAATKIQSEIRGFLARRKVSAIRLQNDSATKIQAHIRGFLTRKHLDEAGLLSPSRSRSSLHSQTSKSDEHLATTGTDADTAATKIQAQIKGYLVRKELEREKEAATKIQAAFRGHNVRKEIGH